MHIGRLLGNKKEKPKYDDTKMFNLVNKPVVKKGKDGEYIRVSSNPSK